jgi:hypothetical protein
VTGIWSEQDGKWRVLTPIGFEQEQELHDLVARTPDMLPLAGSARLGLLGREGSLRGRDPADGHRHLGRRRDPGRALPHADARAAASRFARTTR